MGGLPVFTHPVQEQNLYKHEYCMQTPQTNDLVTAVSHLVIKSVLRLYIPILVVVLHFENLSKLTILEWMLLLKNIWEGKKAILLTLLIFKVNRYVMKDENIYRFFIKTVRNHLFTITLICAWKTLKGRLT